jgi:hypothetical protein
MMKIAFIFAAAAVAAVMLTTAPLGTPAKATRNLCDCALEGI